MMPAPRESSLNMRFELNMHGLREVRGVIFDMDGVLVDTINLHYLSWKKVFDDNGIYFDSAMNEKLRGLSRKDSLEAVIGNVNIDAIQKDNCLQKKQEFFLEYLDELNSEHVLPGVMSILEEIISRKIPMAVASASENAHRILKKLELFDLFEVVVSASQVPKSKPAPDVFLFAANAIGIPANKCLVFEDGESGVVAAKRAGMTVVGLGCVESLEAADLVLESLNAHRFEDIQALLAC